MLFSFLDLIGKINTITVTVALQLVYSSVFIKSSIRYFKASVNNSFVVKVTVGLAKKELLIITFFKLFSKISYFH